MDSLSAQAQQRQLIEALRDPARYPHPVDHVEILETHISFVLLTGHYAYKIKKAVSLGFLDFSTLQARHYFCEEELRLNRRLAPTLYLAVVPITGTPCDPQLRQAGKLLEYAVQMREFPQNKLLDRMLTSGEVTRTHIESLAKLVSTFHRSAGIAGSENHFGTSTEVIAPMRDNFLEIRPHLSDARDVKDIEDLQQWTEQEFIKQEDFLDQRKVDGFIRECHGDLHLGNLALVDDVVTAFDCIEFNPKFRWIDVINEMAFLVTDLEYRGRKDLAKLVLNSYLENIGDYAGVGVLRFYQVYRAVIRAKVAILRTNTAKLNSQGVALSWKDYRAHIALARCYITPSSPALIILHGLSGSGKTSWSQPLIEYLGAILIRSDVERKRLYGFEAEESSVSGVNSGIYSQNATQRTYQHLKDLSSRILQAGYKLIVDATFLMHWQRDIFAKLAADHRVPFLILSFEAILPTLRQRIVDRHSTKGDASEADLQVLEHQLRIQESLIRSERGQALVIDTDAKSITAKNLLEQISSRITGSGQPRCALTLDTD